ncbi:MAG TPA: non-canonical purine NTP pyrophosphatase [Sphaerochaeta sp.]|nr:non-canonical purine NTP pyrophosphatase [Sphaerochaeta sp.]
MNILLATSNTHKKDEFARILGDHVLFLPSELGLTFDFEESSETFTENALGKALSLLPSVPEGYAILADDSGVCVDALGGKPGVRTARYGMEEAGRLLEAGERNALLLKNLAHLKNKEERTARFVCALALVLSEHRVYTISETVEGTITEEPDGHAGFGYDPVFYVDEASSTMAALKEGDKDRYSHRGRATRLIKTILGEL